MTSIRVTVNGQEHKAEVEPRVLLIHFLRDVLRITGPHIGCVVGRCGACTVLWKGKPVKSCMVYAVQVDGSEVMTVEGLAQDGELHPLQEAFIEHGGFQCGFCTPGMILAAKALLDENPAPSEAELKHFMHGNICRCTGYKKIIESIMAAAKKMRETAR